MEWTVLGTSGMVPTKERNVAAHFLKYKGEGILFDCGEGTQRQMNICGIKRTDVTKVLITHWHGDHVSGLIGLIQTVGDEENPPALDIYGPVETKERINHMLRTCSFTQNIQLNIHEVDPSDVETIFENDEYILQAAPMRHSVPCIAYAFVEKDHKNVDMKKMEKLGLKPGPHFRQLKEGKTITWKGKKIAPEDIIVVSKGVKIAYVTDTRPSPMAVRLAEDADLLVSEAVCTSELSENAKKFKHMTGAEAAEIAEKAGVKKLVLTHFSQRFRSTKDIEDEAKKVFKNTEAANDFTQIEL